MELLYRDRWLAVAVKPAGVLSEESEGEADTMPAFLSRRLAEEGMDGVKIYPVHRLDRGTEGIMVYALTEQSAAALSRAVAERRVEKQYVARVHGILEERQGEWRDLLFYDRHRNKSFPVRRMRKGVKEAVLSYEVTKILEAEACSAVRVILRTGRTHQIRVQFASRGYPLVGDRAYGAPADDPKELALRSVGLAFEHPVTGEWLSFEIQ